MRQLKLRRPPAVTTVDRRAVAGPELAAALLASVREQKPELEAFFACLYYTGLRPAEVRGLTKDNLTLPTKGWGEIALTGSQQATARLWTDDDSTRQDRPLKHRARDQVRYVPAPPELVEILRRHLDRYACDRHGHLFAARTGKAGVPLSPPYETTVGMKTVYAAWDRARQAVLTPAEYAIPLAKRPYDLRHAYVSTWLSAGVSPAEIAEQAGNSTNVLLRVYSKPVAGQQERNRRAVEELLRRPAVGPVEPTVHPEDPGSARDDDHAPPR